MKWSIFVCLLACLAKYCEGGALRCPPGVSDSSCTEEKSAVGTRNEIKGTLELVEESNSEKDSSKHLDSPAVVAPKVTLFGKGQSFPMMPQAKFCRPDETFLRDCNLCLCDPSGLLFSCERKDCNAVEMMSRSANINESKGTPELVEESNSEKGSSQHLDTPVVVAPKVTLSRKVRSFPMEDSLPKSKACQPGQEFRMDCNTCLCDNQGLDFSCTRNDCNAVNNNHEVRRKREVSDPIEMKCSPGSVFNQDCNVCKCSEDGNHATCTIKQCKPKNESESEVRLAASDPDFRCTAGEQFKRDCNDCTCQADGKDVYCTVRYCDKNF